MNKYGSSDCRLRLDQSLFASFGLARLQRTDRPKLRKAFMSLQTEIAELRTEIRTDGYPMSIGEWASLYEGGELDIHPEFQRFYRWTDTQKTSLIESILLGIPVPSVFVSQRDDGVWDVVDGLQRLSTLFQFMGILKDENGNILPPLKLQATKYLPSLNDIVWDGTGGTPLTVDLRLIFKRAKINVAIILRESDENTKYDLFQRLNTGGSQASDQEVRNCLLVMLNKPLYHWMKGLSTNEDFVSTVALSERPLKEAYDLELVLRFVILYQISDNDLQSIGDVGVFLTDRMRALAANADFDRDATAEHFKSTFALLNGALGDSAFKRFNVEQGRFMGAFLISQFEVVACGVGFNVAHGSAAQDVSQRVADLWSDHDYISWQGSGITAARRLPRLIPLGRAVFAG